MLFRSTGLTNQDQRLVTDAWKIKTGEPVDEAYLSEFVDHGARDALEGQPVQFSKITYYLEKDAKAGTTDVMIDFQ